jgi:hypothetical protein
MATVTMAELLEAGVHFGHKINMTNPLLLYSTNTALAFEINERFYGGKHYVWCSSYFNKSTVPSTFFTNPPSSTPERLYQRFAEAAGQGDFHSFEIKGNITGLRKGVVARHKQGIISAEQQAEIFAIINEVKKRNFIKFMPLLYIIPFSLVEKMLFRPIVKNRANPLSDEFIISDLPRNYFDVLDLRGI